MLGWIFEEKFLMDSPAEYFRLTAPKRVLKTLKYFQENPEIDLGHEGYVVDENSTPDEQLIKVLLSVDAKFNSKIVQKLEARKYEDNEILRNVQTSLPSLQLSGMY